MRFIFVAEGQTEETFVKSVLTPYLANFNVCVSVSKVTTGRKHGQTFKGGIRNYAKPKNDIVKWLKQDSNDDVRFTTMFDLYALPNDFPGYDEALTLRDPYQRVESLEGAFRGDINDWRFIPYIQLHEFEALILSKPEELAVPYPARDREIEQLVEMTARFDSPERIDDGDETAPSKRILTLIPEYEKVVAGVPAIERIGIETLRAKCPHFDGWLRRLEALTDGV